MSRKLQSLSPTRSLLLTTSAIVALGGATSAFAQAPAAAAPAEPQAAAAPNVGAVEEVVVTGSRIARQGFQAPAPVTVVAAEQLLAAAPQSLAAAVNTMPSMVTNGGPQNGGGSLTSGRNVLNARGLGSQRTLVLLDGRRFPVSSTDNTVDTNLLPGGLVQRVEVVTGGASAAYGSDAVAGVVNFILKRRQDGLEGSAAYGVSARGDAEDRKLNLTWGTNLVDDRLHFMTSFDWYKGSSVLSEDRKERINAKGIIQNPNYVAGNTSGQTRLLIVEQPRSVATYGGLIVSAVGGTAAARANVIGTQFLDGGLPARYNYGTYTSSANQSGGDGVNTNLSREVYRPTSRRNLFARAIFDLTPTTEVFGELQYADSHSRSKIGESFFLAANGLTIRPDNAFLPASVSQQMIAGGITSVQVSRFLNEVYPWNDTKQYTYRALAGVRGKLAQFDWEVSAQKGGNKLKSRLEDEIVTARLMEAADAVVSNGRVVCRSALINPNTPCVPFNWAGAGSPSALAIDYVSDTGGSNTLMEENFLSGNISGVVYEGWGAGPISLATGFDYRDVSAHLQSEPQSEAGVYNLGNEVSWGPAKYTIKEAFAELDVPVLADLPMAYRLSLNGAARRTHYSTSGWVTTWKLGTVYQPISDLRLRSTVSRDIRAPNLEELFSKGRSARQTIQDPNFNRQSFGGVPVVSSGNPNLKPEIADTFVIGGVYSPSWLSGFDVSVDYYSIIVQHAIAGLGFQAVLDRCATGEQALCDFVTRNSAGLVTQINTATYGSQTLKQHGIDYEASWRVPAANWFDWWQGDLTLRAVVTNLRSSTTISQGQAAPIQNAGFGATPKWKGNFSANYTLGTWKTFLQVRYIGAKGRNTSYVEGIDIVDNDVGSVAYVDGQISKSLNDRIELYLNVQNIFDKDAPVDPGTGNWFVPTNENLYDQIGRMFRVGVNFKW